MAMAEGTGGGLIGKIDKIDFSPSDFLNENSSATSSSSSGSNTITIGDKSAASGRSSIGGAGLFKTIVYAGLAALAIGAFFYWDKNGK